ncbi:MAG: chemotaxis-specific protein-glutamate methyltransferase CheB, partial [Helicobacteraceae bacterium]|nr:chemotaxis-specific protein-glutamate methyltransferase CheB [Helicobacteraceae bacterium]
MIRIMIVDDSPLARDMISDFVRFDPEFKVVGTAENGAEAIVKVNELNPDLVTMDMMMPVMNGKEAIVNIHKKSNVPIVVISSLDTAQSAYEASWCGALDFFSKDDFSCAISKAKQEQILETLKRLARSRGERRNQHNLLTADKDFSHRNFKAVVVASSTGGPKALSTIFAQVNQDFPLPIIVVQHNSTGFDESLAEWIGGFTKLKVKLAAHGERPQKGTIYFAPTSHHLIVKNGVMALIDTEPVNNQKPSADLLFASAAKAYSGDLIGVVLTGMGNDGANGSVAIKEKGGIVIAQDESSSLIYGMPKAVFESGAATFVLPLDEIAQRLYALTLNEHYDTNSVQGNVIANIVREKTGIAIDNRKIAHLCTHFVEKYGKKYFMADPKLCFEKESIFDIAGLWTINETYFFRESAHFTLLLNYLLPEFTKKKKTLNICSAACSIGCETYSIAALIEYYNKTAATPIQYHIDAFDISSDAISAAKQAVYSQRTLRDDGAKFKCFLEPYMIEESNGFCLSKSLLSNIAFFTHNILDGLEQKQYDLFFFRNSLIYLTPEARSKALNYIVSSLSESGILLVSVTETMLVDHSRLAPKHLLQAYYHELKQIDNACI